MREKRARDRGSSLALCEKLLLISSVDGLNLPYRDRRYYAGTTRGNVIGPIKPAPACATCCNNLAMISDETWLATHSRRPRKTHAGWRRLALRRRCTAS